MSERIYTRDQQGRLEPLEGERFEKEDELQALIAEHPELLDGTQIRPEDPLRWILIAREQGIAESSDAAARWAVDLLLADQDALPTLVEVKRGANPEIRRTVVGQMLEYAAHAARTWTADTLRRAFEESTDARGLDPGEELGRVLQPVGEEGPDADSFWERVATNLAAARLRLLFVADDIPDPLERVVEFLNAQMAGIEVLAVEIKQFKGDSRQTLVPRVIGRTAASPRSQGSRRSKLDRESFLNAFTNPEHHSVAVRLLDIGNKSGAVLDWGSNGVCIRIPRSGWKKPVGVAWLFPPSVTGVINWRGLTDVSFGTTVRLPPDTAVAPLPEADRAVYASLRRWMEEIAGYDFANDVSVRHAYPARTISYDDAARHIDRLASSLAGVVSEIR
jgi:hypothetical protein